ncbi:hypothetical protein HCN44_001614 [Aphidius gifuensis]|uniref:SET domain-containing protein n=1 Tax=Aphidius gifuensis TaxID=684658 RepID=A0A834XW80_APHGI|nr:hypothetical protein HCN44_001614 [Aphidius gifuensis]
MESRTKEKYDDGGGGGGDNAKWTIDMIKTIMLDLSNNSKLKDEKRIKKILEDLNNGSSGWIIPTPIIESKNALKSIAHRNEDPLTKGFTNGKLDPDKYASVYSLISHCYKNLEKESTSLVGCIITGYFLMQTNKAIENCSGNLKLLKENELFVFIVGLIERNNWIMAVNIFEAGFFTDGQDALPSMTVIAPGASFYNHSCNPMINRNICGGYMISTAICPIKKGQQIFETYGEAYFTEEKKERQVYLNDHHFICKCEACINNWPIPVNIDISKVTPDHEISRVEIVKLSREISQLSSISYDFYRENNKIKDISESLNEGIRLAVVLRQLFKQNSLEVVETIRVLMRIIRLATMVPFVSLQK